jgi:hypothetical protein
LLDCVVFGINAAKAVDKEERVREWMGWRGEKGGGRKEEVKVRRETLRWQ